MYAPTRCLFFTALANVLLASWFLQSYNTDPEGVGLIAMHDETSSCFFSDALASAPSAFDDVTQSYVWGRVIGPHFSADLHPLTAIQRYLVRKEFVWLGVTSGPWLVGIAILQFNYMSTLVVQLYRAADADGPELSLKGRVDVPVVSPFTSFGGKWVGLHMNPTSAGHAVSFKGLPWSQATANLTFSDGAIYVTVAAPLRGSNGEQYHMHLTATVSTRDVPMTGMLYPLGPRRPSIVYKLAAAPLLQPATILLHAAKGNTKPQRLVLSTGHAALDYTRGLLRRRTEWYWACLSLAHGFGLHLSSGAYDFNGTSMESSVYNATSGHTAFLDEHVHFTKAAAVPAPGTLSQWSIRSTSINLTFTPSDGHDGRVNIGVVNVDLNHQWGVFDGTIQWRNISVTVHSSPGVFEEHIAKW